jgi:ubiquinone/menaquinone biosynthesis C-methylase UbiE
MPIATSKAGEVRMFFEQPHKYLTPRGLDVQIRTETVQELTEGLVFQEVLDVGCGDGSISLPLLNISEHVTFLDLSAGMTALAASKVPPEFAGKAEFFNQDFMTTDFKAGSYDLILCLGVLAHVDSPQDFIAKLRRLLKPEGRMIVEFTDCKHPVGRVLRFYQWLCHLRKPRRYRLNAFSFRRVNRMFRNQQLRVVSAFRYSPLMIPIVGKYIHRDTIYSAIRRLFGTPNANRNKWLGEEYICVVGNEPSQGERRKA